MGMTDASMTANANWLCWTDHWDVGGDPVIHEMVHTINHTVFEEIKETYFYERIYEIAVNSIENGIFATSFLQHIEEGQEQDISNFVGEFWAITVEGYIMNRPGFKDSHDTREWIAKNDPQIFELITRYFPTEPWEFCKGIDAFSLGNGKYDLERN